MTSEGCRGVDKGEVLDTELRIVVLENSVFPFGFFVSYLFLSGEVQV